MAKKKCINAQTVAVILCFLAACLIIVSIILTIPDILKIQLVHIVSRAYLVFFLFILTFSIIIPTKKISETFKFMQVRYGPSFFIVFIGFFAMGEEVFEMKSFVAAGIVGIGVLLYLLAATMGPIERSSAYKDDGGGAEMKSDVKSMANRRDLKKRKKRRQKDIEKSKKSLEKALDRVENNSASSKLPPPVF